MFVRSMREQYINIMLGRTYYLSAISLFATFNVFLVQGLATDAERANITSRTMSPAECEQLNCVDARFGFSLTALGDVDKDGFNGMSIFALIITLLCLIQGFPFL